MAHILIVDDDAEVLGTVWRALNREGHEVILADSAQQAWERIRQRRPDLLLLDIMMPHEDGLDFCQALRNQEEYRTLPILFISARWRTEDIVRGLDVGGDDYLTKPFELKELSARVRALLRRKPDAETQQAALSVGGLVLDPRTFRVSTAEIKAIQLTSTEYRLLHQLMSMPDHPHSVRELLDTVWQYPDGAGDPDLVRAHIRNLRAKLEPDSEHPIYIQTLHGVGYLIRK